MSENTLRSILVASIVFDKFMARKFLENNGQEIKNEMNLPTIVQEISFIFPSYTYAAYAIGASAIDHLFNTVRGYIPCYSVEPYISSRKLSLIMVVKNMIVLGAIYHATRQ